MAKRSLLRRVFGGVGRGIDVLRTWLGRLFFLLVLGVIVFIVFAGPGPVRVPDTAALVLAPTGAIVEERDTPALGSLLAGPAARNTVLQDLLDAIDTAAGDDRIASLVLHLDDMTAISPAQIEAVDEALQRFRDGGKPVYAYGDYFSQGQYALAAQADQITLNPLGNLLLQGYGGNQLFFSELLERLNVNVHVFRVGDFKSASEPYTRMDLSEEARSDNQALVDALWQRYVARIAEARELDPDVVRDYADNLSERVTDQGGDMARAALEQGLVDELGGLEEFRQRMASRVGPQDGSFRQIHFQDYLSVTRELVTPPASRVAVLVAEGTIISGEYAPGMVTDEDMIQRIRQARRDNSIRAVVLRVNSPGGGMLASETIRSELALLQSEGKPVVVSMGGTAASGGYWISATADEIWAAPSTITGSIGVISIVPTFEDSLSELGIGVDGVGTTPLTRGADPIGGLSEPMQELLQQNINNAYERFITLVADGRGLTRAEVQSLAGGQVMTGEEAMEAGLVDEMGYLENAVASAANLAGLEEWQTVSLERPRSAFEEVLQQMMEAGGASPAMQAMLDTVAGPLRLIHPELARYWQPWVNVLKESSHSGMPQAWLLCEACVSMPDAR
ncbi:MAG: signal peptide peptidase SppA [Pseudohongiellaceae bacterium]